MKKLLVITLYFLLVSPSFAKDDNRELGKGFLMAYLSNDYDAILNYVDIESFTASPMRTIWQSLDVMAAKSVITNDQKLELIADFKEKGLTEADLKEITNKEYVSYMLIEMFKLQEGAIEGSDSIQIEHLNFEQIDGSEHHIYKATIKLTMEDGSEEVKELVDYKLVTIRAGKVIIPAKVRFLTEAFVSVFAH